MPTEQEYSIGELADLAGVTPRTIRYYVSIGLLPSPPQAGPRTRYSDAHLDRLRLIRYLQRQHLPLAEITARLEDLDDEAVADALDSDVSTPQDSALDYIRGLRGVPTQLAAEAPPALMNEEVDPGAGRARARSPEPRPVDPKDRPDTRTRWERVPLGENVELHIRLPQSRQRHKQIERLIRFGREVLEEGDR
jgi:DNA-binding transcriptional MerR regulator